MNFTTTIRILLAAAALTAYITPTTARAADAPPVEMPDDFDVQCNDNSDDVTEWCDDASDGPTLPPTECKCPRMRSRLPLCGRVAALLLRQSPRSSRRGRL